MWYLLDILANLNGQSLHKIIGSNKSFFNCHYSKTLFIVFYFFRLI